MKIPASIAILSTFLHLVGCNSPSSENPASSEKRGQLFSTDPSEARRQVQAKFPQGISESEAKKIMGDIGAEVSLLKTEGAVNHMLVGTMASGNAEWMIGVSIMDGVVSGHSVNITSK